MTVRYVVEYGDERGNSRQSTYHGPTVAIYDAIATLAIAGADPQSAYDTSCPEAGTIAHNAEQYVANGVPWDSIWSIGDGDNPFTVHGYDSERGNWSVSLVMVREA